MIKPYCWSYFSLDWRQVFSANFRRLPAVVQFLQLSSSDSFHCHFIILLLKIGENFSVTRHGFVIFFNSSKSILLLQWANLKPFLDCSRNESSFEFVLLNEMQESRAVTLGFYLNFLMLVQYLLILGKQVGP